jgi:acyl-CoA thioester hydrolase
VAPTRYAYPVRPRYLEVDQQGVVFNMWYLGYFDEAMAGYLEHRGLSYPALVAGGHDVQLVHTELDWSGALHHGDDAEVVVTTRALGRTSFTLGFDVVRAGTTLCRASTVYVVVGTDGTGPRLLPDRLGAALDGGLDAEPDVEP